MIEDTIQSIVNKNKPIIIYGAGKCGYRLDSRLGINKCVCFCDSDNNRHGKMFNGKVIISPKELIEKYNHGVVIISPKSQEMQKEIKKTLCDIHFNGEIFCAQDVTDMQYSNLMNVSSSKIIREFCKNEDIWNSYFEKADCERWLDIFWSIDLPFFPLFQKLDITNIVELACGRGRHVQKYIHNAGHITLVDIGEKNINYCKDRYKGFTNISYYTNNGQDLKELPDNTYSALFTYDSMVHFESIDVYHYLMETSRILRFGGTALFHHSNYHSDYKASFGNSIRGERSYMSASLFAHFAHKAGLEIVEQKIIDWGGIKDLDAISLVRKI